MNMPQAPAEDMCACGMQPVHNQVSMFSKKVVYGRQ